nr:hypothetical protein [Clostridium botulinum]
MDELIVQYMKCEYK